MKKEEYKILDTVKVILYNKLQIKGTIIELSDKKAYIKFDEFEIIMAVNYDDLELIDNKFF